MFYESIAVIDSVQHKDTKIGKIRDYSFTSEANSIPVACVEFLEASKEYPVTFIKNNKGIYIPTVILGLQDAQNLFVSEDGKWNAFYLPAYVRRYPFVPSVGEDKERLNICIDEKFPGFDAEDGDRLFNEDGSPSPMLEEAVKLIQDYHLQMKITAEFCASLAENDLLEEFNAEFGTQDGSKKFRMTGLYVISEEKLLDLSDEKALQIFRKGEFAWIYSHLNSLSNFPRLLQKFVAQEK